MIERDVFDGFALLSQVQYTFDLVDSDDFDSQLATATQSPILNDKLPYSLACHGRPLSVRGYRYISDREGAPRDDTLKRAGDEGELANGAVLGPSKEEVVLLRVS